MEATLMTYEGPAVIDGVEVADLRMRFFTTYDDGMMWPDEPIELLRGWEAEVWVKSVHPAMWAWQCEAQGVEVVVPGVGQKGRAWVGSADYEQLVGDPSVGGWTFRFVGAGAPPIPPS